MNRMKRIKRREEETTTYWLSYSDMMAALLLIFLLIITFTILQAKIQYEKENSRLAEQQQALAEKEAELELKQQELEEKQVELELSRSQLEDAQEQLDKILGVKTGIVEALKEEFKDSNLKISIDSRTGAIALDSSVLFDFNQYTIKESGYVFLNEFLPKYLNVLLDNKYKEYISEIIVEGHTDTAGTYMKNLELSQRRALSVSQYCLQEDNIFGQEMLDVIRPMITANGRSFSNPVYNSDGTINMDESRRVEFKFRLTDDEMIEEMVKVLNNN